MKRHLRGLCLFSDFPKALLMSYKHKTLPVETLQKEEKQESEQNAKAS